jgi:hypothetical protein
LAEFDGRGCSFNSGVLRHLRARDSLTENTLRTGTLVAVGRRISIVFGRIGRPEAWIGYAKCELGFTYSPHNATLRVTIFLSGREPLRRQGRHPPWRRPGFLFAEHDFINMPPLEKFWNAEAYYGTLAH